MRSDSLLTPYAIVSALTPACFQAWPR
ncbi:hypothetical protein BCEN4_1510016 [Burkholderia cenocepacia]|nr:hypothetical protein BCEN4_1510016 [Burkholderia cenocepacia]